MKKLINLVNCFFLLFILYSCSESKINKALVGEFVIETIEYKNYNLKFHLSLNEVEFFNNSNVKVPSILKRNSSIIDYDNNVFGIWNINIKEGAYFLSLKTKNKYFSGTYKINFENDKDRRLLILNLINDSMNLKCAKSRFNYNENKSVIEDVIELTKK